MLILPAIDLIDGNCVRLYQGDYGQVTKYSEDPVATAQSFVDGGAEWLHIVDLDGAKAGQPRNLEVIRKIAAEVNVKIELGGGITSTEHLEAASAAGVARVILGSALVRDPDFAKEALKLGESVVCGLDARDGKVAVGGWLETSTADLIEFAQELESFGARRFIVTDIATDGALQGPNFELMQRFLNGVSVPVIASGGVAELTDISGLRQLSPAPEGVIVGKALYENRFTLPEAIAAGRI